MKLLYKSTKSVLFWLLAVGFGGICIVIGSVQLAVTGYEILGCLLLAGYLILLYIGWNNRLEVWETETDFVIRRVVDCKRIDILRCSISELQNIKFDEVENASYVVAMDGRIIGLGITVAEGKSLITQIDKTI